MNNVKQKIHVFCTVWANSYRHLEDHIAVKTLVPTCSVIQLRIPENLNLQQENLKILVVLHQFVYK